MFFSTFFSITFETFTAKVSKNSVQQNITHAGYICTLEVENHDDKSVQYDLCDKWICINCAEINHQKYGKLKKDPLVWYRADCATEILFSDLSDEDFKDFFYSTTTPQPSQIEQRNLKNDVPF